MPHLVVVGGGIGGLAAAEQAVREHPGWRVTVLEGSPRVGGKLLTQQLDGLSVDVGAESVLARAPEGLDLLRRTGLDVVHPATTSAWLVRAGRLRPMPTGTVMGAPSQLSALTRSAALSVTDRALVAATALRSRGAAPLTEDAAVGAVLGARLGRPVVERLVDPLLGGVYAGRADGLSLAATVPTLYAALTRTGDPLVAARHARPAPAGGPVFASARGGLGRVAPALAEQLTADGVLVRTGATVRELRRAPAGWQLVVGPTRDEQLVDADAVVLALPTTPAARLLAAHVPHAAEQLAGIGWASIAIVTLVLAADRVVLPPGSGVLVPSVEGFAVKAVTFWTAKWGWPGDAAPDRVVVRASLGRYGESQVLRRDDAELMALVRADLARLVGLVATPVATAVTRWGGALPQYAPGHLDRVQAVQDEVDRLPGLALCGAGLHGLGVPAVIRSARAATERALAPSAAGPSGAQPPDGRTMGS